MLENVCAHESPGLGRGIATSLTERELKRIWSCPGTLVRLWVKSHI